VRSTFAGPHFSRSHRYPPATLPSDVQKLTTLTPAVATPMEAPCEYRSVAACEMTISPALTPRQSEHHSVTIAGLSCASRAISASLSATPFKRRGFARGASYRPPALSVDVQGKRAREHQHAHRAHRAADVGDVQQVPHDGREEKRARGARRGDDAHR